MHIFHFIIPHKNNNYRAKLLHNISLLTLTLAIAFISALTVVIHKSNPQVLGISYRITEDELLNLTNFEREKAGLPRLAYNNSLASAASDKADFMFLHNFWAHYAPDGTTPWKFMIDNGYAYKYAGENLAKGFTTAPDVVLAWMNSESHKANILSTQYDEIGFSIKEGRLQDENTVLIVQMFGRREGFLAENPESNLPNRTVQGSEYKQADLISSKDKLNSPIIDVSIIARVSTFILLSVLLLALILDFVIIEKKRIPRIVGNNMDHIILITVFIAFIFIVKLGDII